MPAPGKCASFPTPLSNGRGYKVDSCAPGAAEKSLFQQMSFYDP